MNVYFHNNVPFRIRRSGYHKAWLVNVFNVEGVTLKRLDFFFITEEDILHINREFLRHDYLTDVIAFEYNVSDTMIGEVYVCPAVVRHNAKIYNVTFTEEMRRVLVHAVLHLCGYRDGTPEEAKEMRQKENDYLCLFANEI